MGLEEDPDVSQPPVPGDESAQSQRGADELSAPVGEGAVPGAPVADVASGGHERSRNMLPGRERRRLGVERLLVRVVATGGVVGIGVAVGAILAASKVQGWIIGLAVALVSVALSGLLWSSRQL